METRRLGQTDLDLSLISYGASSLGHAFRRVRMESGLEAVRVALELGITHFDTSPFYGLGISEVLMGKALRDVPRDQYTISTKAGRYDEDKFDFRPRRILESIDTSLFRLGVGYLDIVFLHDIEFTRFEEIVDEAIPALIKEQEKGKVRYIGIAGYPFKPLQYVMDNFNIDVTLNYNHYTLQNRRLVTDMLPKLQEKNVGILNASPFAQRLLTHTDLPSWHPADAEVRDACRRAIVHCHTLGVDPAKLSLQFAVRHPDLSTCIIGSGNPDNVRNWVKWLEEPYEEQAIKEVEEIISPVIDRNFIYGLPENNDPIDPARDMFGDRRVAST